MILDIDATRVRVVALPGSTGVDIALGLLAEVERLREEAHDLRLMVEEAARAENLNAEDAKKERAAVVAALRRASNHGPMGLSLVNLDSIADAIENGEHRREEER